MPNSRPNPYVGPRSFRTGETMYGRERETLELLDLIIAERIVLLYSPSGAGKTSLIQAALLPKLQQEGFHVTRPMRVSAEAPVQPERKAGATGNRFVLSALLSLEETLSPEKRLPLPALARMSFDEYIKQRVDLVDASPVLVFDQFEEVLTLDPTNLDAKFEFFEQIGKALQDRTRWALFSMREDYLAGLDPYLLPVPTRFATTYRLDLLGIAAAREAIQKPAANGGVAFADAAANQLIDDLRRVQVQRPDGSMELQPGPYVEPVQLQVVCYRLWDQLPDTKKQIVATDIQQVGDVNSALADYYAATVTATTKTSGENERTIREWFDRQLITEQGIRGQVLMEPEHSRGLKNTAIQSLVDAHLVRADERRGATWFELAHDRLIEPVRQNNAAWFQANLSALQQRAELWDRNGRSDTFLLQNVSADAIAKELAKQDWTETEREFLKASQEARVVVEREKRQNRRIRFLALGATGLSIIAIIGIIVALLSLWQLGESLDETDAQRAIAVRNGDEANALRAESQKQERVGKMVSNALAQLEVDPEVSMLLATQAFSITQDIQTDDALRQAVVASRLRETLTGHTGGVLSAAISPDNTRIASGSADGTARVWDLNTGALQATLGGNDGTVWSVTFSPDGKTLVTTDNKSARLWDVGCLTANGTNENCIVRELQGHTAPVYRARYSTDGTQIVTASGDQTAIVWDAASGAQTHVLRGHASEVYSAAFNTGGTNVVTASADQTLRVWDLTNCNPDCPSQIYQGPQTAYWGASFSPDGQFLIAAGDDQNAYKFDAVNGGIATFFVGHTDKVYGAIFSPDGKQVLTASADGTARLWDATYGTVLAVLRGHRGNVNSVAFNTNGELIVTASDDGTAKLWNEGSGDELKALRGHTNKVLSVAFSPDGKRVVTTGQDKTTRLWDAATGEQILPSLSESNGWATDARFSPDGSHLVTTSSNGTVRLWDVSACTAECTSVQISDLTAKDAVFSPDGTKILIVGADDTLTLWDVNAQNGTVLLTAPDEGFKSAAFSPDGKRIVTAGSKGTATVWDAVSGTKVTVLTGHFGTLTSVAFSPDSTWIVTGSEDRTARVWDANTGTEKLNLHGHIGAVNSVAVSPDGKLIVTASADKTARLWDASTGDEVSILRGHTDGLTGAAFSPDGKFVVTSSSDRTARITLSHIDDILALAKTRATRQLSCDEWKAYLQETDYCPTNSGSAVVVQPTIALQTGVPQATAISELTATPVPSAAPTEQATLATTNTTEATVAPTETPQATPAATVYAPTAVVPPTAVPTVYAPTAVTPPTAVPTLYAPTVAPATAAPQAPPDVYAVNMRYNPLDPNAKPTQIVFTVNFLNNTGQDRNYARWRVLVYRLGETKSIGDPRGLAKTISNGTSEQASEPWKINVGACENFVASPIWEDNDGRQTPFLKTDGSTLSVQFQVCP